LQSLNLEKYRIRVTRDKLIKRYHKVAKMALNIGKPDKAIKLLNSEIISNKDISDQFLTSGLLLPEFLKAKDEESNQFC
jgi:hypothetical protein